MEINMNRKIATYLELGRKNGRNIMALQGGRRAGKTYTICQWLLIQMLTQGDVVIFAGMTADQAKRGAYEDCNTILRAWPDLAPYYEVLKSPREIRCRATAEDGRQGVGYFASFQDPETAKGGACDWVFINEANKFTKAQYLDLAANARKGVILDYNPNVHFWVDDVIAPEDILQVTWKDNEKHLTAQQLAWFQSIYDAAHRDGATSADWYYYQVYYEGLYAAVEGAIFTRGNTSIIQPEQVPWASLRNFTLFGDPSALRGADYFPLVLAASDGSGHTYILDTFSTNSISREDMVRKIRDMATKYDGVRIYLETNGLVGIEFFEFCQNSGLPVNGWCSRGNKFDRIIAKYQEYAHNLHFVDHATLGGYLEQVYDFGEKCEHDDNIDAVISTLMLQKFLQN